MLEEHQRSQFIFAAIQRPTFATIVLGRGDQLYDLTNLLGHPTIPHKRGFALVHLIRDFDFAIKFKRRYEVWAQLGSNQQPPD